MDEQARNLLDVAGGVLGELDLEVVIDRVLNAARELTGARYAALGVLNASRTELERFITVGVDEKVRTMIGLLPRGRGVLGELIRDPVALRLADAGAHARSYGFPVGHPPMHTFLGVPILAGGVPFGSLYLTEKAGGAQFTDADQESAMTLAWFAGVAIDHARRYTGAAERRDELARMVAAFEATTEIARVVGGETDLEVILELVAKRGRALVSARALLIELVDGRELVIAAAAGGHPAGVIGQRIALADTVASAALRTGVTQRLEVELNRARFDQHGLGRLGVRAEAGLVVPLVFHDHGYGVLVALDPLREAGAFTAEDQRLLEAFASSAATAVATAQSTACELHRQRLAAAEDERGRWARELHDDTLQTLAALRIRLSAAGRAGGLEVLQAAVADAIDHLAEGVSNLRALVTDLRPAALDELGLGAAVEALTHRASRHGLQIDSSIDLAYEQQRAPTRHTPEFETAIYRIIQEALSNATKHGHAKRAVLEVHEDLSTVELTFRDDGAGFDPDASTAGFGMLGMRERVQLLHGRLEVDSSPGDGTTVTASLPAQRRLARAALATPATVRETGRA
jgi:signal transduction histidine kinase